MRLGRRGKGRILFLAAIYVFVFLTPERILSAGPPNEGAGTGQPGPGQQIPEVLSALVYGKAEVAVKSRTQGEVMSVKVDEGARVKKGDWILQIDDRQEKIDRDLAESEYNQAKDDWDKTTKLKKYVSQDEVKQKEASYLKKKSVFELKTLDINKKRVVSPIDGVVTRIYQTTGETVSAGDKMFDVVQMDQLYLVANVPSARALRFRKGEEIAFKIEGLSDSFKGKIIFTSPVIDVSSETVRVKLEVQNVVDKKSSDGEYLIKPGMVATLEAK